MRIDSDTVPENRAVTDEFIELKADVDATAVNVTDVVVVKLALTESEIKPVAVETAELEKNAVVTPLFEDIAEVDTDFTPDEESSALFVGRTDAVRAPDADSETLGEVDPRADFDDDTETFDDELADGLGDEFKVNEAILVEEIKADTLFAIDSTAVSVATTVDDTSAVPKEVPVTDGVAAVESVARRDPDEALDAELEAVAIETDGEIVDIIELVRATVPVPNLDTPAETDEDGLKLVE